MNSTIFRKQAFWHQMGSERRKGGNRYNLTFLVVNGFGYLNFNCEQPPETLDLMESEEPELVLNGFRFLKCIGKGTYSTVYKVYSLQYGEYFCAKMTEINDDYFDENGCAHDPELLALLNLDHKNIIKCYKYFRHQSFLFLILELCEGGTLDDKIHLQGVFEPRLTKLLMTDILNAVCYCHEMQIAHRDIKPSNIFIDKYGRAKIADFGLSAILEHHNQLVNTMCGSPNYAAPEIYGNKAYDPFSADVWALGVTFYQMSFGTLPFPEELCVAGPCRPPPIFPCEASPNLVTLLKAMLDVNPENRPTAHQIIYSAFFLTKSNPLPLCPTNSRTRRRSEQDNLVRSTISLKNMKERNLSSRNDNFKITKCTSSILGHLKPKTDVRKSARYASRPLSFDETTPIPE